jgi:HEPN domain-containing protein
MIDIKELKSWILNAEEDLAAAKILLRDKKPILFGVCFHAQQCAEKYLKALLIYKEVDFPKTHDLVTLNTLCHQAGIIAGFDPQQLTELSRHAVQTRYPGNQPTPGEAKDALRIASSIRRFARTFLGLKR